MPKKKRQKRQPYFSTGYDGHHLCFISRDWNYGYARAIREHPYFKVAIPRNTLHRYIHSQMRTIPVPSNLAAKDAYEQLQHLEFHGVLHYGDSIEKRLGLLIALFDCIAQETADGFRRQLQIVRDYKKPSE